MRFSGRPSVRPLIVLSMVVAAAVVPVSPARAEGNLTCAFEDTITTTPGLSSSEGRYKFESETRGTLTCFGTLGDVVVAGTGWFIEEGNGYGTCLEAVGSIDIFGELPTIDGGTVEVAGHLWANRIGVTGTATGFINGVLATGPYGAQPSGPPSCDAPPPVARGTVVRGVAVSIPNQDMVAPPSPVDFEAEQSDAGVRLSWAPGEGDPTVPVAGYRVYRDGEMLEIENQPILTTGGTSYLDGSVTAGTHTYTVAAVNDSGIESELAGPLSVTLVEDQPWTPQVFDPVTSPTHLKAKISKSLQSDVGLTWKAPRLSEPDFYRVYSSRDAFQPIATVTDTSYVDPEVDFSCAYSYTYYVTAVDATGAEAWSEPLQLGPFTEPGYACP